MLGNRVVGVLRESGSKWERRAPLTPSHCARLLHSVGRVDGVDRIIVQPCTKRIHPDAQYEDVGCEISEDLSECGLILGIKQPKMENILPDRAYAFFSHSHKAQPENMPLLDKVLSQRVSLYDYELIVGENGKRLLAFGTYAGRTGMIDFLRGLGERFLNLGYSTPFLSLGSSYMYSSLSAAKAAVIAVGEEISTSGLPSAISPLVFVFTGSGNVSQGAQEMLRLLPHTFVDPSELHKLVESTKNVPNSSKGSKFSRQNFQVFACIVTSKDMVAPKDPSKHFDKDDYYAHPELYYPVFHEKIAPYATCIVNCMYWEKRFPRLLTNKQMKELKLNFNRLVGIADITCDIGGSIECLKQATPIECPFFRYDPLTGSYHEDMNGEGVIFLAVDNLPTEVAKEATKHFGDVLSQFLGSMASSKGPEDLLPPIRKACIAHKGELTPLYGYIKRMREEAANHSDNANVGKKYKTSVSLNGHLFDQFLINEALDIIEAAGGSFHLARCELGQTSDAMSYAEIEVSANDKDLLAHIVDLLAAVANSDNERGNWGMEKEIKESSVRNRESKDNSLRMKENSNKKFAVLILGAGHVSKPAIEFLALNGCNFSESQISGIRETSREAVNDVQVIVASLYLQDAQKVIEGIPNTTAVELDIADKDHLLQYISEVDVVISLLPASCHTPIAHACIELKKHLVTASYVDKNMSDANERAKSAGVTILCEMGLDPGIDHMMAMKMINQAHFRGGKIKSFVSYCGGLPSPADANNPLGYKFRVVTPSKLVECRVVKRHKQSVTAVALTEDDLRGFSASKDGTIIHWDVETGASEKYEWPSQAVSVSSSNEVSKAQKGKGSKKQGSKHVLSMAVSSDGRYLATGGLDRYIHLWDTRTQKHIQAFRGHRGAVSCLAFRQGTQQLISGSFDRTIKLWSAEDRAYMDTLYGHQSEILAVDCLRKERVLSVGRDHTLRLWKVPEETQLVFRGHAASLECCCFINNEDFLSGSDDGSIELWSMLRKKPVFMAKNAHGHAIVENLSEDTSTREEPDEEVTTRQLPNGNSIGNGMTNQMGITPSVESWVGAVTVCRGTDLAASGAGNGVVRLWAIENSSKSLRALHDIPLTGFVNSLTFARSGRFLIAGVGQEPRLGRWGRIQAARNGVTLCPIELS